MGPGLHPSRRLLFFGPKREIIVQHPSEHHGWNFRNRPDRLWDLLQRRYLPAWM
jgi:hypothetical protein